MTIWLRQINNKIIQIWFFVFLSWLPFIFPVIFSHFLFLPGLLDFEAVVGVYAFSLRQECISVWLIDLIIIFISFIILQLRVVFLMIKLVFSKFISYFFQIRAISLVRKLQIPRNCLFHFFGLAFFVKFRYERDKMIKFLINTWKQFIVIKSWQLNCFIIFMISGFNAFLI